MSYGAEPRYKYSPLEYKETKHNTFYKAPALRPSLPGDLLFFQFLIHFLTSSREMSLSQSCLSFSGILLHCSTA